MRQFNIDTRGVDMVDLPDAVAMAAALWEDVVTGTVDCSAKCVTHAGDAYGQVVFYLKGRTYEAMPQIEDYHVTLVTSVDEALYQSRMHALLE